MTARKIISVRPLPSDTLAHVQSLLKHTPELAALVAMQSILLQTNTSENAMNALSAIHLANTMIHLVQQDRHIQPVPDPRATLDIPQELQILWKELRHQPLTEAEKNYVQRAEIYGIKIDVLKELLNGLYWSMAFACGRDTANNISHAITNQLPQQIPALTALAYTQWYGHNHLENLAEHLLQKLNLDSATEQEIRPWLSLSVELLSKLMTPMVHRDGHGFHYQLASLSKKVMPKRDPTRTPPPQTLCLNYTSPTGQQVPVEITFQPDSNKQPGIITIVAPDKALVNQILATLQTPPSLAPKTPVSEQVCRTELFPKKMGPIAWGVMQGNADDCYFLAALASVAARNPKQITDMIKIKDPEIPDLCPENNVYMVRFYNIYSQWTLNENIPQWYEVDTTLQTDPENPSKALYAQTPDLDKNGKSEIGFALIEKAWVSHCKANEPFTGTFFGTPPSDITLKTDTSAIDGGIPAFACSSISGGTPYFLDVKNATLAELKLLVNAPEVTCLVAGGFKNSAYEAHAYTLLDVRDNDTIILRDPWGNEGHGGTRRSGQISIPFSEFQKNFEDIGYSINFDYTALN